MSFSPNVILAAALRGHPLTAVELRHDAGASAVAFGRGHTDATASAQRIAIKDGWTVDISRTFDGAGLTGQRSDS